MSSWEQFRLLREKTLCNLKSDKCEPETRISLEQSSDDIHRVHDRESETIANKESDGKQMETEEDKYKKELTTNVVRGVVDTECPECIVGVLVSNSKSGYNECDVCEFTDTIIITDSPEYHNYADNNGVDKSRCGAPSDPLLPKSSISTIMSGTNLNSIRRIHNWTTMPYHERSLYDTFRKLNTVINKSNILGLVKADAKYYYKIIHDKDDNYVLTRGKNRKGVIAACVLYACNQRNIARTDMDIADIFGIELKVLTKGCKKFREILWKKGHKIYFDPISPLLYIERFCNMVGIEERHIDIGKFMAYRSCKLGIARSNTPLSISGGILYTLCVFYEYPIDKKKHLEICNTSDVTITKFFKKIVLYIQHLLPKEERDKIKYLQVRDI